MKAQIQLLQNVTYDFLKITIQGKEGGEGNSAANYNSG